MLLVLKISKEVNNCFTVYSIHLEYADILVITKHACIDSL